MLWTLEQTVLMWYSICATLADAVFVITLLTSEAGQSS